MAEKTEETKGRTLKRVYMGLKLRQISEEEALLS